MATSFKRPGDQMIAQVGALNDLSKAFKRLVALATRSVSSSDEALSQDAARLAPLCDALEDADIEDLTEKALNLSWPRKRAKKAARQTGRKRP